MMMYSSVHSQRYGRAKGMKVKHLVQLVVLTVLFTWFLYQLNSSHKAKVLSLRAEKEDDIDDELLISDDKGQIDRTGAEQDEVTAAEEGQDEFIDKNSVQKSRKMLPDLTDTTELEQIIAEGDRGETITEDSLDDSGEGDRDERGANSDDRVRRTDETDLETKEGSAFGEGRKSLSNSNRVTQTAEDRGDGEDEVQAELSTGKEFDRAEGWATATNFTEAVEDDTLIYTSSEDSKVKGVDVAEVKTTTNPGDMNTGHKEAADKMAELAEPESSESSVVIRTSEDGKKNLTKPDDGAIDHLDISDDTKSEEIATQDSSEEPEAGENLQNGDMTTTPTDVKPRSKSDEVAPVKRGYSMKSNVAGKTNSRSPYEFNEGTGDSPVPMQNGGDTVALLDDGKDNSLSEVKQDGIVEVVSAAKQDKVEGA